jgi:thioredoxin 2
MTAGENPGRPAGPIVRCPHCGKANRVRPTSRGTPSCGSCHRPLPWLVAAGTATFDQELRASVPVLLDLWAPWCAPCRAMAPSLEQLARDRAGQLKVVKVNVDETPMIASRYNVRGIPLLVLTRDTREVARLTGALPLPQMRQWLDNQLRAAT